MQIAFATPSVASFNPAAAALPAAVDLSWHDLTPHRSYLVQFARRRLLDPTLAEDLVHDVFEAVVTGRATFNGRSALRSWLVAILKHKIVDLIRQRSGHDSLDADADGENGNDRASLELVCRQPGPAEQAEQRQLLRQLLARVDALPETLKRVVELRFLQDVESGDICSALQISEQNLFVRLHRARKVLAA
jgi:RNA polymerase sigma-70 factor (ECF subfamily)